MHVYESTEAIHDPYLHGFDEHSLICVSQKAPEKPGLHTHWYIKRFVWLRWQTPFIEHGLGMHGFNSQLINESEYFLYFIKSYICYILTIWSVVRAFTLTTYLNKFKAMKKNR